jgi:hypothetical protein
MVSPLYKGGYGVGGIHAVAPDGESVAFVSSGGFGGVLSASGQAANEYLARRGVAGWSTTSLQPPFGSWADVSGNLEYALANGPIGPNAGFENNLGTEDEFLLRATDTPEALESWLVFGDTILKRIDNGPLVAIEEGASGDLCHLVVGRAESPLLAGAIGTNNQIYDLARGCDGEPSLRFVALNNKNALINPYCGADLGIGLSYAGADPVHGSNSFNAVSADGEETFFTTRVNVEGSKCANGSNQLFVRIGGEKTLEVSKPVSECAEVPCAGALERANAYFKGASVDGSRVYFTTAASLTEEDNDTSEDLYMATIGCPLASAHECRPEDKEVASLVRVSHVSSPGESSEIQGVTKVARDGTRIYFVARGLLGKAPNAEGHVPIRGAENLYVYDSLSGKLAFVADLCSTAAHSGMAQDVQCPGGLGDGGSARNDMALIGSFPEAQTAGQDGRFLVFSTYARLLHDDTDNTKDVYRYDAQTGELVRVSLGEEGYDADGNDNAFDSTIALGRQGGAAKIYLEYEMGTHAISEDGTRITFTTASPLSPDATNGLPNVYEWDGGNVSLISSGNAEEADGNAVITFSGRDIFFTTAQGLVSQDHDGAQDIYDARIAGGFGSLPAQRQPCAGDACQGGLSVPGPLLVPGSVTQVPGENLPLPKKNAIPKKKASQKTKSKKHKAKHAKGAHPRVRGAALRSRGQ